MTRERRARYRAAFFFAIATLGTVTLVVTLWPA
jgi:hypothetical protein